MENENCEFGLKLPFWIDTDGYSDRDRAMFVAGYEFATVVDALECNYPFSGPIHSENESRVRMACAQYKRRYAITPTNCEGWSNLVIWAVD